MKYKGIGSGGLACFFGFGGDFCDFKRGLGCKRKRALQKCAAGKVLSVVSQQTNRI